MALKKLGPYVIERQLGQGGMGTVYAAVHEVTGMPAAVKVLSTIQGSHDSTRIRFDAEIETLKALKHPNIVQLLGYGEQDGHLFYAMELVDGKNLHDELRTGRVFLWRDVTQLAIEICAALKHAHDFGVIHRDLKPANLLLTSDGHVKLADFGIAKMFGSSQVTMTGGVVGTVEFMSPEQADGLPITVRSDLYSLGCVLYTLLTRRPPFTGKTIAQVMHSLKFEEPIMVRRLALDTPAELETVVHQLLEKDPQNRIPTALVLSNRLRAIEHGLSQPIKPEDENIFPVDLDKIDLSDDAIDRAGFTRTLETNKPTRVTGEAAKAPSSPRELDWESTQVHSSAGQSGGRGIGAQGEPSNEATFVSNVSRFTMITEEELRRSTRKEQEEPSILPILGKGIAIGLLGLLIAGVVWSIMKPASADRLYEKFSPTALAGDFGKLENHDGEIEQFLERFPNDPRATEVREWREELERQRKARQLTRTARRQDTVASVGLVEREFLAARNLAITNPELAEVKLRALLNVFEGHVDDNETLQKTVTLARGELERLEKANKQRESDDLLTVRQQLDWAEANKAKNLEGARAVWRGVIELFAGKPWAEELVGKAREALRASESAEK